ncbi:DNA replication/repair protein RecF [Litoribrevibacter albus]|uniref:DNA replication and repair protein RecF n=1 Tax=Litoribrevibacter albus TaxID=1473156 RepID=A0AA37W978_9GAMM|nr:DNA replication/repair protein RecF [Litoribrevibacter albus]GLQ32924.1 DNA replication and repair protein RecF [Litoribrevibacter albus]
MLITQLKIDGLRNLSGCSVTFDPVKKVSLFIGNNGAGKTSVLEAIHCLATGNSFRSTSIKHLVTQSQPAYTIFSKSSLASSETDFSIGVTKNTDGKSEARLNGEKIKSQETISSLLPVIVLEPGSFDLVIGSPEYRRRFMDWGVFHVKHEFWSIAARFKKAAKQRNSLLRSQSNLTLIRSFTRQLVDFAEQMSMARLEYFNELKSEFERVVAQLTDLENVEMRYNRGWSKELDYADYLDANLEKDREAGYTRYGPHRADLVIRVNGLPVKEVLSRGQLKLLVCALVLAQCRLFERHGNNETLLLLDDLPSELDEEHRNKVLQELIAMGRQVFMTSVDVNGFSKEILDQTQVFHVKQGKITASTH